ncbi:MAG TPA: YeeE/YedE thiosulfate transporter family protein [Pirellulaceae bacterium]|nr:YeeE/YedE thiosulfate transporter family protein [Pirellulaceae bacterium]
MSQILEHPTAGDHDRDTNKPRNAWFQPLRRDSGKQLLLGLVFGVVFGFLLQKGGVAKYHVLMGQLLLDDFTVLKVMMSAVIVGMLGVHFMNLAGLVELHIKPTRYVANVVGGLLFGVGFGLAAYCPGTGAAALGQGNFDAIGLVIGMVGGSYLFAEASGYLGRHLTPIGDRGKLTFYDWLPYPRAIVILFSVATIGALLAIIETLPVR